MSEVITPFRKKESAEQFIGQGFCVFPLLSEDEVEFALGVYNNANGISNRLHQSQFYGVNYSLGTLGVSENERMMEPLVNMLREKLANHFADFEVLGCVFITKPAHTSTVFVYHQDWNYTDEQRYAFVTCWVPLCPVSPANGGMSLIEGSHRFFSTFRSESLDSARIPFDAVPEELRTDIVQQPGSCLSFHQALFHGSYPNATDQSRPVLAFVVKPVSAPIFHYVKGDGNILAYELSSSAFNHLLTQIPKTHLPDDAVLKEILPETRALPEASALVSHWRIRQPRHRLFINQGHHRQFITEGFIHLPNVISKSTLESLKEYYHSKFTTPEDTMYVTNHYVTDADENKRVSSHIFGLIENSIREILTDYQPLLGIYAAKKKGKKGLFNLHQDWSIIQEELFGVLHCWIPLQDTDETNGTLVVLPGSHLLFHNYRSGTCPIRFTPIETYKELVHVIRAKAGDMVAYHPALFHGSGESFSESPRVAVVATFAHREARKVYFHRNDKLVYLYGLTETDLFSRLEELARGSAPLGGLLKEVPFRYLELSDDDLQKHLSSYCSKYKQAVYAEV